MVSNPTLASRAADWICLAAAPTFGLLALVTSVFGNPDMLCAPGDGASVLGGMSLMYLLMSAFHLAPWLKLMPRRRRAGQESYP
jgi:hypothetical protein